MGRGDKCLLRLSDKTVLAHLIDRLSPQVHVMALNANGDADRFRNYGLPVLPDVCEGYLGPLAGALTALKWAAATQPSCHWVQLVSCDTPFVPKDLSDVLLKATETQPDADIVAPKSLGRTHLLGGLWHIRQIELLEYGLIKEEIRAVNGWADKRIVVEAEFPVEAFDPFFNVNHPEDLEQAETILKRLN